MLISKTEKENCCLIYDRFTDALAKRGTWEGDGTEAGELHRAQGYHGRRQERADVAVDDVAQADGRVGDERPEAVAAGARGRRRHPGAGEEVRARHQPRDRRVALGWLRLRRGRRRAGWQPRGPWPARDAGKRRERPPCSSFIGIGEGEGEQERDQEDARDEERHGFDWMAIENIFS